MSAPESPTVEPSTGAWEVAAPCEAGYAFDPLVDDFVLPPVAALSEPEARCEEVWLDDPLDLDTLGAPLPVALPEAVEEDPEPGEPPDGPFSNAEPRIAWLPWPGPP